MSARLYQGAGAELKAEREVHSRGSAAQRVTRKVLNLAVEFHVCQPRFQVFCQYLSKNAENSEICAKRGFLGALDTKQLRCYYQVVACLEYG